MRSGNEEKVGAGVDASASEGSDKGRGELQCAPGLVAVQRGEDDTGVAPGDSKGLGDTFDIFGVGHGDQVEAFAGPDQRAVEEGDAFRDPAQSPLHEVSEPGEAASLDESPLQWGETIEELLIDLHDTLHAQGIDSRPAAHRGMGWSGGEVVGKS